MRLVRLKVYTSTSSTNSDPKTIKDLRLVTPKVCKRDSCASCCAILYIEFTSFRKLDVQIVKECGNVETWNMPKLNKGANVDASSGSRKIKRNIESQSSM